MKVSGKNVKMSGSRGVCAEGKQVAAEGDRVTGFDVHIMVVPAGTANVPLPHPFMGELKDNLAKDLKVGSRKCATKGSVARHGDAAHMQLPGTIKFQQSPKKEGEVTGGTSAKVRIGGKEAVVIGSTVTTCNDIGARDNSTVMAAGASMPMPKIINPLNTEEWKREREDEDKKEPSFQSARWSYRADRREIPPEEDSRFTFTAHSAWCPWKKSENSLEVKLRRPEITRAEWRDKDGNATNKGLVGKPLRLHAEARDFDEGQGVTLTVRDAATGETAAVLGAEVRDGIAEAEWTYHYNGEKLTEKPKFTFEVSAARCRKAKSPEVEIAERISLSLQTNIDYDAYGFAATD